MNLRIGTHSLARLFGASDAAPASVSQPTRGARQIEGGTRIGEVPKTSHPFLDIRGPARAMLLGAALALGGCASIVPAHLPFVDQGSVGAPIQSSSQVVQKAEDFVRKEGEKVIWNELGHERSADFGTLNIGRSKIAFSASGNLIKPSDTGTVGPQSRKNCTDRNQGTECTWVHYAGIAQGKIPGLSLDVPLGGPATFSAGIDPAGVLRYDVTQPVEGSFTRLDEIGAAVRKDISTSIPVTEQQIKDFSARGGKLSFTARGALAGNLGVAAGTSAPIGLGISVGADAGVDASASIAGVYKVTLEGPGEGKVSVSIERVRSLEGGAGIHGHAGLHDDSSPAQKALDEIEKKGTLAKLVAHEAGEQENKLIAKYFSAEAALGLSASDTTTHIATVPFDLKASPELASVALSMWHLDAKPVMEAAKAKKVVFVNAGERDKEIGVSGHLDIASQRIIGGSHSTQREGGFVRHENGGGVQSVYRDTQATATYEGLFTGTRKVEVFGGFLKERGKDGEGFVRTEFKMDGRTTLATESLFSNFLREMGTKFDATACKVDDTFIAGWARGECGRAKGDMVVYFLDPAIEALAHPTPHAAVHAAYQKASTALGTALDMSVSDVADEAENMARLLDKLVGSVPKVRIEALAEFTKGLDTQNFWIHVTALNGMLKDAGVQKGVFLQAASLEGDRVTIKAKPSAGDMPSIEAAIEAANSGVPHLSN